MVNTTERVGTPRADGTTGNGTAATAVGAAPLQSTGYGTDILVEQNAGRAKNRVQWGPVIAGTATALITMLLLAILGLAVGASAFEPGTDVSDWGTAAGIWGAISAIIALFFGGWIAARTAAVGGSFAGLVNGFLAGVATLLLVLWLTTTGVTNLLGFLGNNVADIAAVASDTVNTGNIGANDAQSAANQAQTTVTDVASTQSTYDTVRDGAWGTLIAMLIGLGAAALGGWLGSNRREDVVQNTY